MNNSANLTSMNTVDYITEPAIVVAIRVSLEVLIAFLGVIENALVCAVILCFARMHTSNNYYVLNASIADLGLLLITFPLFLTKERAHDNWPFGELICRVAAPISDIFQGVSFWSITAIAVSRFRAICSNDQLLPYHRAKELKKVKWVCFSIWLLSFVFIVIPVLLITEYVEYEEGHLCLASWNRWPKMFKQIYHTSRPLLTYALPLTTIIFCYVKIALRIGRSSDFHRKLKSNLTLPSMVHAEKEQLKQNSKITDTLYPMVVIFAITTLPLNAMRAIVVIKGAGFLVSNRYFWIVFNISRITLISHAAINPMLYGFCNRRFREALQSMLALIKNRLANSCASLLSLPSLFLPRNNHSQPETNITDTVECWDTHLWTVALASPAKEQRSVVLAS